MSVPVMPLSCTFGQFPGLYRHVHAYKKDQSMLFMLPFVALTFVTPLLIITQLIKE